MKRKIRLLCCGSRDWSDYEVVFSWLKHLHEKYIIDVIIEGEAQGADTLSKRAGRKLGIPILPFKAQWKKFGRAAGPIRNQEMLHHGKPTMAIAFHKALKKSKGTKDMVERLEKKGIKVFKVKRKYESKRVGRDSSTES